MVKAPAEREWYIRQAVQSGWTRNVLVHQIEGDLHRRQGRAVTNFQRTLPAPQSELAQELLKIPTVLLKAPWTPRLSSSSDSDRAHWLKSGEQSALFPNRRPYSA